MRRNRVSVSLILAVVLMLSTILSTAVYAAPKTSRSGSEATSSAAEDNAEENTEETAGSADDSKETVETDFINSPAEETEWNVYIYMCGSDLESHYKNATDNIKALLKADYTENARFILQTGGAKEWHTDWIDADKLQRFVIQGSNRKLVWEDELKDMAYPDTLSDFIKWGKKYYPSKKSMLIIWDHGSAYEGAVIDEQYRGDLMSVRDYEKAFTDAGAHFDVLDFDCCLMADLDVCLDLSPYADYIIASEESMDGCGQDYYAIGNYLAFNPGCSGKTLGRAVCGSYVDYMHSKGIADNGGLSLIDTSKLPAVKETFLNMIKAMEEKMSDTEAFSRMLRAAYAAKSYSYSEEKDLVSFARDVAPYIGEDVCEDVVDAVRKAVVSKAQIAESTYNNGISFYWAPSKRDYAYYYSRVTNMNEYLAFIDAIIWKYNMPSRVYENTERLEQLDYDTYSINYEMQEGKGVFDTVKITSGQDALYSMYYSVYGTYNDRLIEISKLGNISYDNSGTLFKTAFDGTVAAINGEPLVLNVISETADYILYDAPVYADINGESELRNLRIAYLPEDSDEDAAFIGSVMDEEHGSFEIIGFANNLETSAGNSISKDSTGIRYDTVIYPAYPTADGNTMIKGAPVVYDKDTVVAAKKLEDGTYYLSYEIESSLGQVLTTETEEFQIKDGAIAAPEIIDEYAEQDEDSSTGQEEFILSNHENGSYHMNMVSYKKYHGKNFVDRYTASDETGSVDIEAAADKAGVDNAKEPAKVTQMIFMIDYNNETNLGVFTKNVESLMQAQDSDKVNVIMQTGGGYGWKGDCFDTDAIQRFEVHHDTLVEVSKQPQYNMSTEASLEDYIKWCAANYPAEHYIIEFFDHGGAWYGVCWDEKYESHLSLDDISTAMKNSGIHFDLTYLNMCLMSTIEVAAAIQPYSDYMLASEESTWAIVKSEGDMVDYIIRHADDLDAAELGKHKAETYISDVEDSNESNSYQSLSVIDLSKIPAVVEAVDQMGREMSEIAKDPAKLTKLIRGLDSSRKYEYDFMRDIVDLTRHADGVSTETKSAVANAVNDAVYYTAASKDFLRTSGLTIHFDVNGGLNNYSDVCPAKDYLAFLDCINLGNHVFPNAMSNDRRQKSVSPLDFEVKDSVELTDDNRVSLVMESDPDIINDVSYRVMRYDSDQDKYYYMYYGTDIDFDDREEKLTENFDGRTTALGGKQCYMSKYCMLGDKILFNIPVKYYDMFFNIRVAYSAPDNAGDEESAAIKVKAADYSFLDDRIDFDNGTFEVLGIFQEDDIMNGFMDDPNYELENGMEFILQVPEADAEGNILGYVDGEELIWDNNMNISLMGLQDGDYALRYVTINGLLHTKVSDTADLSIRNGRIKTIELADTIGAAE